ncbi:hypothetical protein H1C71_035109 [Ictidomys tridecemlineatus]|nr:hypothetical protein H1C71_035109 [Ictidomys tridecemlineatus]
MRARAKIECACRLTGHVDPALGLPASAARHLHPCGRDLAVFLVQFPLSPVRSHEGRAKGTRLLAVPRCWQVTLPIEHGGVLPDGMQQWHAKPSTWRTKVT